VRNALVFCNRKRDVDMLYKSLRRHGFNAGQLHGDMDQSQRTATLESFKRGEIVILVCSDVAARGLDIDDLSHVFNFDVPIHAEDYVHRIGRTGRAGASGLAVTFVTSGDGRNVADLEKLLKKKLDIEAFEFDDERPRGRINDGRRNWREHGVDEPREGLDMPRHASTRPERGDRAPAAPRTPADPFFSQPYEAPEATTTEAKPAWEAGAKPAANRISANIKPKRKLAALFASVPAEPAEPAEPADSALAPEAPADQSAGS